MDEQHRAEQLDRFIDALQSGEPFEPSQTDDNLSDLYAVVRELHRQRTEGIEWPDEEFPERLARRLAAQLRQAPEPAAPLAADEPQPSANGSLPPVRDFAVRTSMPPRRRWPHEGLRLVAAGLALFLVTAMLVALFRGRSPQPQGGFANGGPASPSSQILSQSVPPEVALSLAARLSTPVASVATPPQSLQDLAPAVAAALQLGYGQSLDLQQTIPGATVRLKWAYADTRFVVLYYQIDAQLSQIRAQNGSPDPVPSLALWPPMLEDQAGRVLALRGGSTTAFADNSDEGVLWFDASQVATAGDRLTLRLTASALRVADPGAPATPAAGSRLFVATIGASAGTPSTAATLSFNFTVDVRPAADLPLVQGSPAPTTGTSSTSAAAPVAACDSSQLEARLLTNGAALGNIRSSFELRNSSSQPCSLTGYLRVQLLDAQQQALAVPVENASGQTYFGPVPEASQIILPPGTARLGTSEHQGHAFFSLISNDVCPNPATTAKNVGGLALRPPGASQQVYVVTSLGDVCDPQIEPVTSALPTGNVMPTTTPTAQLTVPVEQAGSLWQTVVRDIQGSIEPILEPSQLPTGFDMIELLDDGPGTFRIQYDGPGRQLVIGVSTYNPALCGDGCTQRQVTVRGQQATLQVDDASADPPNHVWLWWTEPGTWTVPGRPDRGGIEYLISADGLTANEVLQVANSLAPVQPRAAASTATAATPCRASQLRLASGDPVAEPTGQHSLALKLSNSSKQACSLDGYPTVSLLDAGGNVLSFNYGHTGDQVVTAQPPQPVELAPGDSAYVTLNKYRCDLGTKASASSVWLQVPGDSTPLQLSLPAGTASLDVCSTDEPGNPGAFIAVSPFEPTAPATLAH